MDYNTPREYNNPDALAERVQSQRESLAAAEAALAAQTNEREFRAAINERMQFSMAVVHLLSDIRDITYGVQVTAIARDEFAKFKTKLNAIANEYNAKLVLVGDKSQATVVLL
jgi:hypothetical protein